MSATPDFSQLDIIGNQIFGDHGYPHEDWAFLRKHDPVHWWDREKCEPFWAVTKHEDIIKVSRQPRILHNGPRMAVFPGGVPQSEEVPFRHLLIMDPPEHGAMRKLASHRFTPRGIRQLEPHIESIAKDILDGLVNDGETSEMDFVESVAAPMTLWVLADMLGVPREDWRRMFRWTNEIAGANDPEYNQGRNPNEVRTAARKELFLYFSNMAEQRRSQPTEDMVSVLSNAKLDGAPLPPPELLGYFFLLVIAGNETTRNAASGGLLALIENPAELAKLKANPGLIESAVEEIVRWTTPVIQFCRTATEPFELRDKKIEPGQAMCLLYPSANRDEEVFEAPNEFRIDRDPNPHLGFGIGEHFCLGASLARMELKVIIGRFVERTDSVELAGPFERVRSSFLGGVKHMPIRYRLRAAS